MSNHDPSKTVEISSFLPPTPRRIGILAGNSPSVVGWGLWHPRQTPHGGVCTSAGTAGPGFEPGRADAAVVIAADLRWPMPRYPTRYGGQSGPRTRGYPIYALEKMSKNTHLLASVLIQKR